MIPIPVTHHVVTLCGQTVKQVQCQECGNEYVYLLTILREGESESVAYLNRAGAVDRASHMANQRLASDLERGCSVVPCPHCGRVQDHMVPLAREGRHRRMLHVAVAVLMSALVLGGLAALAWWTEGLVEPEGLTEGGWLALASVGALAAAVWLLRRRRRLCDQYDPNAEPVEERKAHGRLRAWKMEEIFARADEARRRPNLPLPPPLEEPNTGITPRTG